MYYTPKEAAREIGVSVATVYRALRDGYFAQRDGRGQYVICENDFRALKSYVQGKQKHA